MALEDTQVPSGPNLITDRRGHYRDGQYVAPAGADTWNEYAMAKYNNEYNYWLLQQQQAYNSPEQQVARLKAAGLNPNFNSIEGAGNTSYEMATSKRGLSSNVGSLGNQQLGLMLNAFNSTIGAIAQGVDMTSKVSHMPSDIKKYRKALTESAEYKALSDKRKSEVDSMLAAFEAWTMGQNISAPFNGWTDQGTPRVIAGVPINYQGQVTGLEDYSINDSPRAKLYAASLEQKEKYNAYLNAQKTLADLRYNIDKWQSDPEVLTARKDYLNKQLEILGVDKNIREWIYQERQVTLAIQIGEAILNTISGALKIGSIL